MLTKEASLQQDLGKDLGKPEAPADSVKAQGQMEPDTFIGDDPPRDGREWDAQCARCGSSLDWHQCDTCGGEGTTWPGELHELDPLWYDEDDYERCPTCWGKASFPYCLSSEEWCEAHPIEGRENVDSGTPEWFVISRQAPSVPSGLKRSDAVWGFVRKLFSLLLNK